MIRPSTMVQDQKILECYFDGIDPKIIVLRLELTSIHVVYEALRRGRIRGAVSRVTKIHQNSPRTNNGNNG